ncbi:MAG: hypothetical protein KAG97_12655, partial [Victivallales bacterium]|nr:hypothetical protein [Victivallales bacterium]
MVKNSAETSSGTADKADKLLKSGALAFLYERGGVLNALFHDSKGDAIIRTVVDLSSDADSVCSCGCAGTPCEHVAAILKRWRALKGKHEVRGIESKRKTTPEFKG